MKKLNAKAIAKLHWIAETMHCMGGKEDRTDAAALTMLLDWHDSDRKEVERLREALEPFARMTTIFGPDDRSVITVVDADDIRRARKAMGDSK